MLRERLDLQQNRNEDQIQKIKAEGNQKLKQFKESIAELRQSLEEKDMEQEVAVEKVISRPTRRLYSSKKLLLL